MRFSVQRSGQTVTVQWEETPRQWQLLLAGVEGISDVIGGSAERTPEGAVVTPSAGASELKITL